MDFSDYKFRCSSLGSLMTNQQGKKDTKTIDELSETAKGELIKVYIEVAYGRQKEIQSKYIEKGLAVEEDSITLLSMVKERYFVKNEERKTNDYITGEADITNPLYDTKSCWDIHTFYAAKTKPLKKDYEYQMMGYCELYDQPQGTVAFCLIDTPSGLIEDEKNRLFYRMNVPSKENLDYLKACENLEKEMTFNDIPLKEKVHEIVVKRASMEPVYKRIELCRIWLNDFAGVKKFEPIIA